MKGESLNGVWERRVGYGKFKPQQVPYSTFPVGHSECKRTFDLSEKSEKTFLRFDGITYFAKVFLNGKELGEMLPYSEYVFDITEIVKEKENELLVELEDISPAFGPSEGWENYGGIIRGVTLLYANASYIRDAFFSATLENNYQDGKFKVALDGVLQAGDFWRVTLSDNGKTVCSYEQTADETERERLVKDVCLWSPEDPHLYDLKVELVNGEKVLDTWSHKVGFREFSNKEHRFLVNGKETFILGVCRHDTYGECGHTLSIEQIKEDFKLIKELGCNYVRLVHYPHDKRVLEIADETGLFVSEEPGLWWSDTANEEIASGSLEVLRRVIVRDRNHPSVAFWLCFNECFFTEKFLKDSADLCKKTDPTRLVSGANCMTNEDTLIHFNRCGFDFYTMHPYYHTPEKIEESARILKDKPLLLTEWGGFHVYDNPHLLADFIAKMRSLWLGDDTRGYLAGACFWNWAEIHEYGRGRPACADGLLKEALIDINRNKTMIYETFKNEWAKLGQVIINEDLYEFMPENPLNADMPLSLSQTNFDLDEAFNRAHDNTKGYIKKLKHYQWKDLKLFTGPILQKEEYKGILQKPLVLSNGHIVKFGAGEGKNVTLVGATSLVKGYPLDGVYGEPVASVTVTYADGETQAFVLKNGEDITTVLGAFGPSRIDPIAENALRLARFRFDNDFENYVLNGLTLPLKDKPFTEIEIKSENNGYELLVYGLYL